MKFIEVMKDHFRNDDEPNSMPQEDRFGLELIRTEDVVHVYEVKGGLENYVCIECKGRKGNDVDIYEKYEHHFEVINRIKELNLKLNGGL